MEKVMGLFVSWLTVLSLAGCGVPIISGMIWGG